MITLSKNGISFFIWSSICSPNRLQEPTLARNPIQPACPSSEIVDKESPIFGKVRHEVIDGFPGVFPMMKGTGAVVIRPPFLWGGVQKSYHSVSRTKRLHDIVVEYPF
jgi:hypothetical protein